MPHEEETRGKIGVETTTVAIKNSYHREAAISKAQEEEAEAHSKIEEATKEEITLISQNNHFCQQNLFPLREMAKVAEEEPLFTSSPYMLQSFTLNKKVVNNMGEAVLVTIIISNSCRLLLHI